MRFIKHDNSHVMTTQTLDHLNTMPRSLVSLLLYLAAASACDLVGKEVAWVFPEIMTMDQAYNIQWTTLCFGEPGIHIDLKLYPMGGPYSYEGGMTLVSTDDNLGYYRWDVPTMSTGNWQFGLWFNNDYSFFSQIFSIVPVPSVTFIGISAGSAVDKVNANEVTVSQTSTSLDCPLCLTDIHIDNCSRRVRIFEPETPRTTRERLGWYFYFGNTAS
jgi:hypothetical protein